MIAAEYASGLARNLAEQAREGAESIQTDCMNHADIGWAVVESVALPYGRRPFRATVDSTDVRANELNKIGGRIHAACLTPAGMADVLRPSRVS